MNALANPEVGKFVNEHFCSSYQKVATFRVVGAQKQGGNVATYFCAPDGRVLHVVAGPVGAQQFLQEARWVVDNVKVAMADAKNDGAKFKAHFRKAHAEKLRREVGVAVEPVTFDPPEEQDPNSALTYADPTGRPLAPRLPPPPIEGPDVRFKEKQDSASKASGARFMESRRGGRVAMGTQGVADHLMAAHCMVKIEKVYGTVFENILGEKITTKPVEVVKPFSWRNDTKVARPAVNGKE